MVSQKFSRHWLFIALIIIALLIGGLTAGLYGETADDEYLEIYANHTLDVYATLIQNGVFIDPTFDNLAYYGPAFLIFAKLGQSFLNFIQPNLDWFTSWHFMIFFSYLIGVTALYTVSIRFFPIPVAVAISLIFATQPVLWGQGFLNAKDTPMMSFMLLAIALGIRLEDLFPSDSWDLTGWTTILRKDWAQIRTLQQKRIRKAIRNFAIIIAGFLITILFWESLLTPMLAWAFSADPDSWLGKIIASIAPNANRLPVSGYVSKLKLIFQSAAFSLFAVSTIFLVIVIFLRFKATKQGISDYLMSGLWRSTARFWKSGALWAAAVALAFTVAIRVAGPFAGVLVLIFLIWRKGPQVLGLAIPYLVIAGVTTFLLWPFLWSDPIGQFVESIRLMSAFPWGGRILFEGDLIRATKLPAHYLPSLLGIQLTLPAVVLFVAGVAISLWEFKRLRQALVATLLIWLLLPLVYIIVAKPAIYHNFRQLLFIIPPIFILAGFALTWIFKRINSQFLFAIIIILLVLPGIIGIIELHPYEYVYYNELVGGVRGAEGRYEMEYWSSALTEATRHLNSIAPPNSLVASWGKAQIVGRVARPDLRIELLNAGRYDPKRDYDYVLVPLGPSRSRYLFAGFPEILVVERLGVAFAVVDQLNCGCATFDPYKQ